MKRKNEDVYQINRRDRRERAGNPVSPCNAPVAIADGALGDINVFAKTDINPGQPTDYGW
jgi:hypothetical protein